VVGDNPDAKPTLATLWVTNAFVALRGTDASAEAKGIRPDVVLFDFECR